jgi:transcription initiation factor IIE alpha subunit
MPECRKCGKEFSLEEAVELDTVEYTDGEGNTHHPFVCDDCGGHIGENF